MSRSHTPVLRFPRGAQVLDAGAPASLGVLAALLGVASVLSPACRRAEDRSVGTGRQAEQALPADHSFPGEQPVSVWEVHLRQEILLAEPVIPGEEPAAVAALRRQLARRSALESRLLLHPLRIVWELPEPAMPGGAADPLFLVLRPKSDSQALVSHRRRRYRGGSPARLAAWLEGSLRSHAPLLRLEVLGQRTFPSRLDGLPDRREMSLLAVMRASGASGPTEEVPRRVLVVSEKCPVHLRAQAALLWDAIFLPLLEATSLPVLEPLRAEGHWPRRVEILPTQGTSGGVAGAGLRVTLDPAAGRTVEVPRLWLRAPPERYEPEFGPLLFRPDRRLLHRSTRGLRDKVAGELDRDPLTLRNAGNRTLYVYGDGLLLGWVGPRGDAQWKVLPPGYYRLAAHSLFGTELWGPRDVYLPGPVNLSAD